MLTLIQNLGLLLALTFVYSLTLPLRQHLTKRQQAIVQGVIFGAFGAVGMLMPVELGSGFLFDGRNVIVVVATIFGGYVAGFITCGIIIPVRLILGGAGVVSAAGSVLTTVVLTAWTMRRYGREGVLGVGHTTILGVIVALQGLAWLFLTPFDQVLAIVQAIAVPLLIMTPLAMALIIALLGHEVRRAALESALRESEHRLRQIADTSEQALWVYDIRAEKMLYVSPGYAHIWQRPVEALMNDLMSSFNETVVGEDRELIMELVQNPRPDRPAAEVRILRPDGSLRWVSVRTYPVVDSVSGSPQIVGTVIDITDQKRAEVEHLALEIERKRGMMLRQFISDASHDLRTPITIMNTSLYLLGRTLNEQQQPYLERVQVQVNRMARLIEDMLEITRLDSGEIAFDLTPYSLNQIARDAYERRKQEAASKERALTLELMEDAPRVAVDESELAKAIDRVTKNAIAYTQLGGSIHIATRQQGESAILEVRDDGVGIPDTDLPHIFERFYRADKARGAEVGGAGLGLSIAQRALELHGGDIVVESASGAGTTVRFVLPVVAPEAEPAPLAVTSNSGDV